MKELLLSLLLGSLLYASWQLSLLLEMPHKRTAQIPHFKNQAFCFSALPLQVMQSWILEQQLESKDEAVQEVLKKFASQFKNKPQSPLQDFQFDVQGAIAYYLIDHPKKQFSCIFLPGKGLADGWNTSTYFAFDKGLFVFTEDLSQQAKHYFEESLQGLTFENKAFEARKHHFELQQQTYTLNWEEHAFSLELPKVKQQGTKVLSPDGFHLSCPLALSNLPHKFKVFEELKACSINYYGAQLNSEQALNLEFEALLRFEQQQDRDQFISDIQKEFADWQWSSNFVRVNDAVYALKKEGHKQLYICSSPKKHIQNGKIQTIGQNSPIICAGDPTLLTKLDNAGWAAAILELFPLYRGISDFSQRTAQVSTNGQTIRWELKKDYFAAGEFLKLLGTLSEQ